VLLISGYSKNACDDREYIQKIDNMDNSTIQHIPTLIEDMVLKAAKGKAERSGWKRATEHAI